MNKKILITGGLGYIGTELCKFFVNSEDEVIVVDNLFIPHRVKWLVDNKIKFFQRDIFDINDILKDIDVVYHLAGVTDVPQTKEQSNAEKDELIYKIGVEGTRNLIKNVSSNSKIVFPSTHVIFEGLTEQILDIDEDFKPCPILSYARSKRQNELDLLISGKKFTILRLASVYGRNSNIRLKIVTNLFAKMASQNETIKLFGGGLNYKPLVGVNDVARALVYFSDNKYDGQIFNIVNENITIKELADLCLKYNKNLKIESTSDNIPNLGYTLSNKKILNANFTFNQNISDEMSNMIKGWKNAD